MMQPWSCDDDDTNKTTWADTWNAWMDWWIGWTPPGPVRVWSDGPQRVCITHVSALDPDQYRRWSGLPDADPARVEHWREQFILNDTRLVPGVVSVWEKPGHPRKWVYDGWEVLQAAFETPHEMHVLLRVYTTRAEQQIRDDAGRLK